MQPSLVKAMEAIIAVLLHNDGIYYRELVRKACKASGHAEPTIGRATRILREEGSIRSQRFGYEVKYFIDERVKHKAVVEEEFIPVRRSVVSAADAPRVGGVRLSPIEWMLATLMTEVA